MPLASAGATITDSAQIKPKVIDASDIADDILTKSQIAPDAIETSELAANAVETGNIKDGEIVDADISASAGISDTKLAEISSANKVNGTSFKNLAGIPAGAGSIPAANLTLAPGEATRFCLPVAVGGGASIVGETSKFLPVARTPNGSDNEKIYLSCFVPGGKTSISSIKVLYKCTTNTGAVNFRAKCIRIDGTNGGTQTTDGSVTDVSDNVPGTAGDWKMATLPADNYNALTTIAAGDVIAMELNRDGSTDTCNGDVDIAGVMVTFA